MRKMKKTATRKAAPAARPKAIVKTKAKKTTKIVSRVFVTKVSKSAKNKKFGKKIKIMPKGKARAALKKIKEPQEPRPHKKKHPGELKKSDSARFRKLYEQQEKLWTGKLNVILSDSYIRQVLIDLAGENTLEIIRNFNGHVSDEDLAKRLKLKISDVRATLNKLHNESLVYYIRQKDSETGWYSYSWLLNKVKMEEWTAHQTRKRTEFATEGNDHYFCPGCGLESMLEFEKATEIEFRCQKCSKGLEFLDREKFLELTKA